MERTIRGYGRHKVVESGQKENVEPQTMFSNEPSSNLQLTPRSRVKALLGENETEDFQRTSFSTLSFKERLAKLKAVNHKESDDLIASARMQEIEEMRGSSDGDDGSSVVKSDEEYLSFEGQSPYQETASYSAVDKKTSLSKGYFDGDFSPRRQLIADGQAIHKSPQMSAEPLLSDSPTFRVEPIMSTDEQGTASSPPNDTPGVAASSPTIGALEVDGEKSLTPGISKINNEENIFQDWNSPVRTKQNPKVFVDSEEEDATPDIYQSQIKAKPVSIQKLKTHGEHSLF
jgi:hypothetical protein